MSVNLLQPVYPEPDRQTPGATLHDITRPDSSPRVINGDILRAPVTRYVHIAVNEYDNPALAQEAWRVHAEGYHAVGFVTDDAITPEGFLVRDIDSARGEGVEYYLAINPANADDCSTLSKIHVPLGGSFRDLPGYRLTANNISAEGMELLEGVERGQARLKEISGLAKTESGSALGIHELLGTALHESIRNDEVWLFSIVSSTYDALAQRYGTNNFVVLGEDTPIIDPRVSPNVALRPTILYPRKFISNLYQTYLEAPDLRHKMAYLKSLKFVVAGLEPEHIPAEVASLLANS